MEKMTKEMHVDIQGDGTKATKENPCMLYIGLEQTTSNETVDNKPADTGVLLCLCIKGPAMCSNTVRALLTQDLFVLLFVIVSTAATSAACKCCKSVVPNLGPPDVLGLQLPEIPASKGGSEGFWELRPKVGDYSCK